MNKHSPNIVAYSDYGPIIVNTFDRFISQSIFKTGYWARKELELIKKICSLLLTTKDSITFYDVGSNIGTHSLALSKTFEDKIKIRAFEAQSSIFNMLCGTLALNNISNVHAHRLAVSNESNRTIHINLPDYTKINNLGGFEVLPPLKSDNQSMSRSGKTEPVQTIQLDSFSENVDFIKLDIEGMELLALQGAGRILKNSRPYLFVEIIKTDKDHLFALLKENNYRIFSLGSEVLCTPVESELKIAGLNQI